MRLSVYGAAGPYIPGDVPTSCAPDWLDGYSKVKVRDARTGRMLAKGRVGGCKHLITTDPVCIPGIGCLPSLVSPIWGLKFAKGLPIDGITKYKFKIASRTYVLAKKKLESEGWEYRLADAERRS